jgi:hypothetical protein
LTDHQPAWCTFSLLPIIVIEPEGSVRFIADLLSRVIPGLVFTLSAAACILACSSCSEKPTQPPPPPATEPDTTSHDFTWTTYTLGDGQSYLQDVYAVSDTDVWAVGEIYLKDSTGNLDCNLYEHFNRN